jgi:hypothetical protein
MLGLRDLAGGSVEMSWKPVVAQISLAVLGSAALGAGRSDAEEKKGNTRVYELRTYTTLPGRLPALHKRFAEHTLKLFEKHGMRNEMYWIPTDAERKDNTLIYVVSHDSQEAADRSWKAFIADPEWIAVRDASEKDGKILAKPPERVYMTLTDYSPQGPMPGVRP